jgi:hypothetical protein
MTKVNSLGRLLDTHEELLAAFIVSGLSGHIEVRQCRDDGIYALIFCGHDIGFESITIYQDDRNFELKKQRILDYLNGKTDYLEEKGEIL